MYQSNNQHSCCDWFIYGNDLAKVRLLLPALLCIMVQTTLAVAKIWYLFDNAKYFSSHVRYNHKISCISEVIENVQKWTFSIAISLSPNSIIALKRLTLLAFRKSSNVISAFVSFPCPIVRLFLCLAIRDIWDSPNVCRQIWQGS